MEMLQILLPVKARGKPLEYLCCHCRQVRLSLDGIPKKCSNCGNKGLIMCDIGTIDIGALNRHMNGVKE